MLLLAAYLSRSPLGTCSSSSSPASSGLTASCGGFTVIKREIHKGYSVVGKGYQKEEDDPDAADDGPGDDEGQRPIALHEEARYEGTLRGITSIVSDDSPFAVHVYLSFQFSVFILICHFSIVLTILPIEHWVCRVPSALRPSFCCL